MLVLFLLDEFNDESEIPGAYVSIEFKDEFDIPHVDHEINLNAIDLTISPTLQKETLSVTSNNSNEPKEENKPNVYPAIYANDKIDLTSSPIMEKFDQTNYWSTVDGIKAPDYPKPNPNESNPTTSTALHKRRRSNSLISDVCSKRKRRNEELSYAASEEMGKFKFNFIFYILLFTKYYFFHTIYSLELIEENWGGLNTPRSTSTIPKTRRSLKSILNPQKFFGKSNKNVGHILKSSIKAKRVNFGNTCGFDAFVACLCVLNRDRLIKKNDNEINTNMDHLVEYLVTTGYNNKAEALKELILSEIFKVQPNIFSSVDCNNNVCFFVEKTENFSYSIRKSCECGVRNKNLPFIYLDAERKEEIAGKFQSVERDVTPTQKISCPNGHIYEMNLEFNDVIYFTITMFNDNNSLNIISNQYVPDTIIVNNFKYILKCIVNYREPRVGGIGHYQGYCRTPLGRWEVYDNSVSNVLVMKEFVVPHLFVYAKEAIYK